MQTTDHRPTLSWLSVLHQMTDTHVDGLVNVVVGQVPKRHPSRVDHLVERTEDVRLGHESDGKIDVDVLRLGPPGRDLVSIDPSQVGAKPRDRREAGLFGDLPACSGFDRDIVALEVPTWLEPSIELPVQDQEQRFSIGREHEPRSSEVPRVELSPTPHGPTRRQRTKSNQMGSIVPKRHIALNNGTKVDGSSHKTRLPARRIPDFRLPRQESRPYRDGSMLVCCLMSVVFC